MIDGLDHFTGRYSFFFIFSITNLCSSLQLNLLFVTPVNFVNGSTTSAKPFIQFLTMPAIYKGNQSKVDSRRILSNITLLNMLQLTSRRILRD